MTVLAVFVAPVLGYGFSRTAEVDNTIDVIVDVPQVAFPSMPEGGVHPLSDTWEAQVYAELMARPEAPPPEYWDRLAACETRNSKNPMGNWQNGGRHGGGLGFFTQGEFAQSTMGGWERFGGEQFADHPADATKRQQVIVGMRTAFSGWRTIVDRGADVAKRKGVPRHYLWDRSPFGYWTWGCAKGTVGDPCGYLYDGSRHPRDGNGRTIKVPHRVPGYCKYLEPINYRKEYPAGGPRGSGRYAHNRNTQRAIAEWRAAEGLPE